MSEHEHDWQETGIHVPILDCGPKGFRGECHGSDDCDWSFGHQDIDAVRRQAIAHLKEPH